jgi:hypothetical protein
MTIENFCDVALRCISEDCTRPALGSFFRFLGCGYASNGHIAVRVKLSDADAPRVPAQSCDQAGLSASIDKLFEDYESKVKSGMFKEFGFGYANVIRAVTSAALDLAPHFVDIRGNPDDEDDDVGYDSVATILRTSAYIVMPDRARHIVAAYGARTVAMLYEFSGGLGVTAYTDESSADSPLYFKGPEWSCALMGVRSTGIGDGWPVYASIADGETGRLISGYNDANTWGSLRTLVTASPSGAAPLAGSRQDMLIIDDPQPWEGGAK